MITETLVAQNITEHREVLESLLREKCAQIQELGEHLTAALKRDATLFWCGNGGSAAESQHLAAELVGRFKKNRRPLRSIALTSDTSVLTCIANDFSYDDIFARQIEALGRRGDVLIGISTSGNSENVISALKQAKAMGLSTVALLGKDGGNAQAQAELSLIVPSASTARIQEMHMLIGHILCDMVEKGLGLSE